jgi:outer membrane receptor protein involved in Fe transport
MKHVSLKAICVLTLVLVSVSVVFAGNGKITGVVKDSSNGEPIVGANIVLEGTSLGGATNLQGVYVILNVPPGNYNIRASAIGFAVVVIRNVQVNSDQTVTEDLRLSSKSFELREVVVEAERKLVDKTLTSTRTVVSTGELNNNLPILSVQELLNTTASVYKGRIRGSQKQETKTLLDGIDITDQFGNVSYVGTGDDIAAAQRYNRVTKAHESAGTVVDLNSSSLSELSVIAGAANAEYVSATAGVYSANLREGRGAWNGRVFFRTGGGGFDRLMKGPGTIGPEFYPATDTAKYFTNKRSAANIASGKSARYGWTPGKYDIGETPTTDAEVSLGGSVADNFGLFFTGRLNDSHGSMPNEFNREANISLKANYDFTKTMKFVFTGVLQDRGQIFGWKNRSYNDLSRYFLEGVPVNDGYSAILSAKLTQFLSQETFYEVQVSHIKKSARIGFLDSFTDSNGDGIPDVYDQRKGSADYLVLGYDTAKVHRYIGAIGSGRFFNQNNDDGTGSDATITNIEGLGQVLANPTYYYENLQTSVTTLKGDFVSQLNANHQVRAGAQVRLHSISQDRRSTVISPTDVDPAVGVLVEQYDKKPVELGLYAQDRIEFSGLIVNIGARLDEFDPDAAEFANFYTPYINPQNGTFNTGARSAFVPFRGTAVSPKWFFSPRIGVSHPISEDATMYFSFSRTSQPLPFAKMYTAYNNINNTSLPNQVRANQDPYKSTNYEFGATWEFLPRISLNANAYFREIENFQQYAYTLQGLAGQTVTTWNVYFNSGYADARGVELTLNLGQYSIADIVSVAGRVNYTWSVIKAPVGGGASNKTGYARNTADSVFTQLPFDDAKSFKQYEINIQGGNSVLGTGFDRTHRVGYALSLRFPYEVLLNVVGTYSSGFLYTNPTVDNRTARQLETGPSNSSVDVRVEKGFVLAGKRLGVFMDVKNLFNKGNILAYATYTGASSLKFYTTGDPTGEYNRAILPEGTSVYDTPRQVYLGAYFEF